MEAIVLAGGLGTRLRNMVPNLPKPMAPIAGRPFLEILLDSLAAKGFDHVILSLGFMAEKISSHFGNRFANMDLTYAVEQEPLGTGGALRLAMNHCRNDHVFIFNGDTFLDLEIDAVEQQWSRHHHPIIVGRMVPDTARYGRLLTDNGRVVGLSEKGIAGPGLINAGCYVFNIHQLNGFSLNLPFSLESDYLAIAVNKQRLDIFVTTGHFIDIGVPEDYRRAQSELAQYRV